MDEGKATGPKPKWWSRPVTRPGRRSSSEADAQPAGDTTAGDSTAASGAADGGVGHAPGTADGASAAAAVGDTAAGDSVPGGAMAAGAESGPAPMAQASIDDAAGDGVSDQQPSPAAGGHSGDGEGGGDGAAAGAESGAEGGQTAHPLHAPDPYSTPPYGGPGPWAPAPPVQRPMPTPAHGTTLPPGIHPGATPAHGTQVPPAAAQAMPPPGMTPAQGTQMPPAAMAPTGMTPAHGTQLPPGPQLPPGTQLPPGAQPDPAAATAQLPQQSGQPLQSQPAQTAQWQHYDPWTSAPDVPRKPSRRRGLVGAVLIALIAGCLGGGIGAYLEHERTTEDSAVHLPQASADQGAVDPDSVSGIAARALPGVVTIHVSGGTEQATGTGFVLDDKGHILTNNHVVEPAGSGGAISVTFSGGEVADAKVIGRDSGYDLAVIKVDGVSGLHPLALGNSDSVRVGDPVVAIGAPYDLAGTVTSGIISAKERPITAGGEQGDGSDVSYVDALQTDAPINPGNSGGPLVDSKARVIGINSAIRAADDGSGLGGSQGGSIGLGFAIPINQGKRVAEELINTGKATHPVIGVTLDMEYAGDGARVHARGADGSPVNPGGPGDKAGIKAGDIVTEVDGVRVHSGQELIVKIRSHRPGDRLRLTLRRDGRERTVELTLGSASGSG
ncbi:trypsin-like peptidase domain-containing protein [Streptomyces sp. NBS 14/10]|uniref:trypsin-like peptidase domain-containing protein n=1 Tax=Streptomyces sp. NBS 14/10 TaxID=1945643 RepID=UPI000B7D40DD|nr:trypsin-like peptidase domain-containing protein [Streptomyces sp. NBS 14/10]KAK1181916.1 trypsin-like peptidase domain-containing protein [Streptomyces sp. NBS 14/10]